MYFFVKQFWDIRNWVMTSTINRVLDFFPRRRKNPIKTQLKQTIKFDPKTTQFKSNNVKIKLEQKKYDYNPQYYGVFSSTN